MKKILKFGKIVTTFMFMALILSLFGCATQNEHAPSNAEQTSTPTASSSPQQETQAQASPPVVDVTAAPPVTASPTPTAAPTSSAQELEVVSFKDVDADPEKYNGKRIQLSEARIITGNMGGDFCTNTLEGSDGITINEDEILYIDYRNLENAWELAAISENSPVDELVIKVSGTVIADYIEVPPEHWSWSLEADSIDQFLLSDE